VRWLVKLGDPASSKVIARAWRKEELCQGARSVMRQAFALETSRFTNVLLRTVEAFEETAVNYHTREGIL
jgi:hypothetical protein